MPGKRNELPEEEKEVPEPEDRYNKHQNSGELIQTGHCHHGAEDSTECDQDRRFEPPAMGTDQGKTPDEKPLKQDANREARIDHNFRPDAYSLLRPLLSNL